MHVVLVVAGAADRIEHWLAGDRLGMAGVAIQPDMPACQRELGLLVVIEMPQQPPFRGVAGGAFRSKPALVERILVAVLTQHRRRLEVLGLVAVGARHRLMLTDQREPRPVVVKVGRLLPIGLVVA